MFNEEKAYDAIVIGAGPGGATAALVMAREGLKVLVLERSTHPRFHIGESILPRCMPLIQELGLEPALRAIPHVTKIGAEFAMGDGTAFQQFTFENGLLSGTPTFNVERSHFDAMLVREARQAGAEILENQIVNRIHSLTDGAVSIGTADGRIFSGRYLFDASGQATVVARHLGIRRNFDEPELQKVAYFSHFDNVERLPGPATGHPSIILAAEGWFWLIGLNETKTSVGFVARPSLAREIRVAPDRLLAWAIARCPVVRHRMRSAIGPDTNQVLSDFSYRCDPQAGPGYFLIGDAGAFLDPIFSTGVTLAMMGAVQAAQQTARILRGQISAAAARRQYIRYVTASSNIFWRLIRNFYTHSFRECFLNGTGPMRVHAAVITILAGQVFPRPVWALRWRLRLFEICVWLNRFLPFVPRRTNFSLVASQAVERPTLSVVPSTTSAA